MISKYSGFLLEYVFIQPSNIGSVRQSISKQSWDILNSRQTFSSTNCRTKDKEPSWDKRSNCFSKNIIVNQLMISKYSGFLLEYVFIQPSNIGSVRRSISKLSRDSLNSR